jgi:MFS transporter, BCD family, chlorophyll transporter
MEGLREQGGLSWIGILRLGLVQTALGAIVVLTTSTLNRVMVVELALAATIPGMLVGAHYAIQLMRPVWGYGSDAGGRRTPWILGGMSLLALGAVGAAIAAGIMQTHFWFGLALAFLDFLLIGIGVGAAGTSLLALLASSVAPQRRPAAATIVWLMMIAGMAITATVAGGFLDPFSFDRLVAVTATVGVAAIAVTALAVAGVEAAVARNRPAAAGEAFTLARFLDALKDAWAEPQARLFTIFVFVSMLAYSAQDLILEPFAGIVFDMTPGETTRLSGTQHGGVFAGMVLTGLLGTLASKRFPGVLRILMIAGCVASAAMLAALALSPAASSIWPLETNVFLLGAANGVFAVAAIGSMMALAGAAGPTRTGMRMGLWGAAQAIAFGLGGLVGTIAVDLSRAFGGSAESAFGGVFLMEAAAFLAAAIIATRIAAPASSSPSPRGTNLVAAE